MINAQTRNWDVDLLHALFKPEEVQLIRGISLGDVSARDRMIWPHTQSGTYTVKSGYNLLSKEKENLDPLNTNPAPPQKLWKIIWSLSVPPKVRNFLWRAAKNAIPVKTNLVKRLVLQEEICDHYKAHSEDVIHALWLCPCLNEVWETDTSWNFRNTTRWDDFQKLILHVDEAGLDLDLFTTIIWLLWHRRNQIRVNNSATSLGQIVASARQQLQDYNRVQPTKPATEAAILHTAVTWSPPRTPFLKINYDGVVFRDPNKAGLGAVVRDSMGGVLASLAENIPLPQTVADVEAAAARRAIMLARDLNLSSIILEGDLQIITRVIQAEEQSLASYVNLIEEIKSHAESFLSFRISHVKRNRNSVAHSLARHAKHVSGLVVWMEEVPSHILPVLLADAG